MRTTSIAVLALALAGATTAAADIVTCSSDGHEHHYCQAETSGGVELVHQLSKAGCWRGDTWGYDRNGIWVANGCRAEFRTGYRGSDYSGSYHYNSHSKDQVNWNDPHDADRWAEEQARREETQDDHKAEKVAGAAIAIGVLAAVAAHNSDHHDDHQSFDARRIYTCESSGKDHHYCTVPGSFRYVTLKRQLSRSSCQYNRSWGYDRRGIWVGDGCRAEFWVE